MTDASIWGGNNGEINIGLDSGDTLTFTAFDLLRDLPVLKKLCQEEINKELDKILDERIHKALGGLICQPLFFYLYFKIFLINSLCKYENTRNQNLCSTRIVRHYTWAI